MKELNGNWVLVNPELGFDPLNRQGALGMVISNDLKSDSIEVGFGGGETGWYSADALLVPREHNAFYKEILSGVREIPLGDMKYFLEMSLLTDRGSAHDLLSALQMAKSNPVYLDMTTQSLEEKIKKELGNIQQKENDYPGMSR